MGSEENLELKTLEEDIPEESKIGKDTRQVGHLGPSFASVSCTGSDLFKSKKNKSLVLMKARLREEELKKEYELLKARNEVQLAELALESDCESIDEEKEEHAVTIVGGVKHSSQNAMPRGTPKLDLPKIELEHFDGNPRNYWRFVQQFKYYVEARIIDNGQRLLYLLHYSRGAAKEAISECVMLPPVIAYDRAREILRDLFGREHVVARALLEDMFRKLRPVHDNAQSLSRLAVSLQNCHIALSQMGYLSDMDSISTLERILRTLPLDARRRWARIADDMSNSGQRTTFFDLSEFVSSEARVARSRFGMLALSEEHSRMPKNVAEATSQYKNIFVSQVHTKVACPLCEATHQLPECSRFLGMSTPARWNLAKRKRICFVCLQGGHVSDKCQSCGKCGIDGCSRPHHQLLHNNVQFNSTTSTASCHSTVRPMSGACLGVVPVRVRGPNCSVLTYAFLDSGSDVTLVEKTLVEEVGLKGVEMNLSLSTISGCSTIQAESLELEIEPLCSNDKLVADHAFCISSLPVKAPVLSPSVIAKQYDHLKDTSYFELPDKRIRLLIGEDVPKAHWPMDRRLGKTKEPYAVLTPLGWVIFGPLSIGGTTWKQVHCLVKEDSGINGRLEALYNSEFSDIEASGLTYSAEDRHALDIVSASAVHKQGHYEIALPLKSKTLPPNNYKLAYQRLQHLRRRFVKDPALFTRYQESIENCINKKYIEPVPAREHNHSPRWYLPHHPVINPKKANKLRVVMDCAAKFDGISLNDCLYQGPDTTANLTGVLLRFRREPIAVAADITEMFMQVKVPEGNRNMLRILWCETDDPFDEPKEFRMTSHPFGAKSSPFCANFALTKTVTDWSDGCLPEVQQSIENYFYVDDCLASLPDQQTARRFVHEISCVLSQGGFRLRKWISNDKSILQELPESDIVPSVLPIDSADPVIERTLGLEWDSKSDAFRFKFIFPDRPITRRGILSAVSSLFDPLGLVAPLLLPAKLLLQRLCKKQLNWDDSLGSVDIADWHSWLECMKTVGELRIPRCIRPLTPSSTEVELHVFSDASELGYGIVAYCRWFISPGKYACKLLFSKSRVAPLKSVTIPRLELNAARLAVRVAKELQREIGWKFNRMVFWTDSMIVLHYIRNTATRFSIFVANRVTTIHQLSSPGQWRHIGTCNNPADLTSRGTCSLKALNRWIIGPVFLELGEEQWPVELVPSKTLDIELKNKDASVNVTVSHSSESGTMNRLMSLHSDWIKLLKTVAWLIRFRIYVRMMFKGDGRLTLNTGHLKVSELRDAESDLIRLTQNDRYFEVIRKLSSKAGLTVRSSISRGLYRLCPILIDGILCVGGRLSNAECSSVAANPAILPGNHHITELLIRYHHVLNGHSGPSQTMSDLRQKYWIVQGMSAIKRFIRKCWICRRNLATANQQIMSPLPIDRVNSGWHPFKIVGCDYFGPMLVRNGRKTEKRYGCIFTCLQMRAVHLEMAYSLSADSFISVLMRFIARRGAPNKIISDNGSNFVGAEQELKRAVKQLPHGRIIDELLKRSVEWQFNPPLSSHRGGVWERLIRSVRRVLRSTANEQTLTDEKLGTLLIEAERILNSRPLVPVHSGVEERPALTPNDLLILNSRNYGVVPPTITERYVKGWQQVNYLTQVFWKRWLREYLPLLQQRKKWLKPRRNLKPGDVVLVISSGLARERWPLGIVEEVETSSDGLVRTVAVRTREGKVRRDIRKVALIEGCE